MIHFGIVRSGTYVLYLNIRPVMTDSMTHREHRMACPLRNGRFSREKHHVCRRPAENLSQDQKSGAEDMLQGLPWMILYELGPGTSGTA